MAENDSITYTLDSTDYSVICSKLHSLFIVLQGLRKFQEELGPIEEIDIKVALDSYQDLYSQIVESVEKV